MNRLIIRITAIVSAFICLGCQPNFPLIDNKPSPQPPVQTIRIEVGGTGQVTVGGEGRIVSQTATDPASTDVCQCGCGKPGCGCLRNSAAAGSATPTEKAGPLSQSREVKAVSTKPVVTMFTDFNDGECGACDLAWWDWMNNGGNWPFTVVKKRGNIRGGTSPTFILPDGQPWSPVTYSVGDLVKKVK